MPSKKSTKRANRRVPQRFQYKASDRIGFADATNDVSFLEDCYFEKGQIRRVIDTTDPGTILVGRTGCGKTAGLIHIRQSTTNCVEIRPDDLSLGFIANSDVLSFLHELGVDLDLLFQLLWRHVLCVELIKCHYERTEQSQMHGVWERLKGVVRSDQAKKTALEYVEKWGSTFWEVTQERIREVVRGFEQELEAAVKANVPVVEMKAGAVNRIREEEKATILRVAQEVVSKVQIRKLTDLMAVMRDDIFTNRQARYYVLIDGLDEQWVVDSLRYRLIRSLIEAVKSFRDMDMVKVVIALRLDLIEYVYRMTRSKGFQREKYEDLHVRIEWSKNELYGLLDTRIEDFQRKRGFPGQKGFLGMFQENHRGRYRTFDYLVDRTQLRPRDLIEFVNLAIRTAAGKTEISAGDISTAEIEHSRERLLALFEEWELEYPDLEVCADVLRGLPTRCKLSDIPDENMNIVIGNLFDLDEDVSSLSRLARRYVEDQVGIQTFRVEIVYLLHQVGMIGIRSPRAYEGVHFTFSSGYVFNKQDLSDDHEIHISPMLWQVFKNQDVSGDGSALDPMVE